MKLRSVMPTSDTASLSCAHMHTTSDTPLHARNEIKSVRYQDATNQQVCECFLRQSMR